MRKKTKLLSAQELLREMFPIEADRPSLRWLRSMQAKRILPFKKIGGMVRFDPDEVRQVIDENYTIHSE